MTLIQLTVLKVSITDSVFALFLLLTSFSLAYIRCADILGVAPGSSVLSSDMKYLLLLFYVVRLMFAVWPQVISTDAKPRSTCLYLSNLKSAPQPPLHTLHCRSAATAPDPNHRLHCCSQHCIPARLGRLVHVYLQILFIYLCILFFP